MTKNTELVNYLGRTVPAEGFRTFVYGADGKQKVAQSWKEYLSLIESGLWFDSKKDAKNSTAKKVAKQKKGA